MIALLVATTAIWGASIAAGRCDAVADFYRGRSISLVIGFGAGGGYDAYARLLARHIGRHIPGNPSLVAQNMQGAGGLKATQFLYDVAPRDGTVIGTVARGQPLAPLLLGNTSFEATRFTWIGSVTDEASLCLSWFSLESQDVAGSDDGGNAVRRAKVKVPIRHVRHGAEPRLRRKGRPTHRLPFDREMTLATNVRGRRHLAEVSATTLLGPYADWIAAQAGQCAAQMALRKDDRFPTSRWSRARAERRAAVDHPADRRWSGDRPTLLRPPGIPEDRKQASRVVFDQTMQDRVPGRGSAREMDVNPMQGAEMESFLRELYAMPKDLVDKAALAIRK